MQDRIVPLSIDRTCAAGPRMRWGGEHVYWRAAAAGINIALASK
jgi:hypothetical protein